MALRYTTEQLETVCDNDNWDKVVVPLLTQIFELMDENQDGSVDDDEGSLMGIAMGEDEDRARRSFLAMCQDMDDDGNTSIEIEEWLSFYEKSLKDAVLSDVMEQLNIMKNAIETLKEQRANEWNEDLESPEGDVEADIEGDVGPDGVEEVSLPSNLGDSWAAASPGPSPGPAVLDTPPGVVPTTGDAG